MMWIVAGVLTDGVLKKAFFELAPVISTVPSYESASFWVRHGKSPITSSIFPYNVSALFDNALEFGDRWIFKARPFVLSQILQDLVIFVDHAPRTSMTISLYTFDYYLPSQTGLLGDWEVEFGENFFHVLPDSSAVVGGVVAQQVCGVVRGH